MTRHARRAGAVIVAVVGVAVTWLFRDGSEVDLRRAPAAGAPVVALPDARPPASAATPAEEAAPAPADWLARAQRHIAAREYWASESERGLQAPNRAHGLRTLFEPDGIRVLDRMATDDGELHSLTLDAAGANDLQIQVKGTHWVGAAGQLEAIQEQVIVELPEPSALTSLTSGALLLVGLARRHGRLGLSRRRMHTSV